MWADVLRQVERGEHGLASLTEDAVRVREVRTVVEGLLLRAQEVEAHLLAGRVGPTRTTRFFDTWELDGAAWTQLSTPTSSPPYFGNDAFQVEVHGVPSAVTLLALAPLPGSSPVLGCTLLVAPAFDLFLNFANPAGFAPFRRQIPFVPQLRGLRVLCQAAQLEPSTNTFTFTNGLALVLGD